MSLNEAAEKHVITHNGYRFSKKKESKKCVSYWCVCNRSSKSKCTAKMKMDLKNAVVIDESGDHDESCSWKNGKIPEGKKDLLISLKQCEQEPKRLLLKN